MQRPRPSRWPIILAVCALVYLVGVVFSPIFVLGYEFVESDVVDQVIRNLSIRGLTAENLKHIFTSRCVTSYYPIRTLTYAIDYQAWGLDARGFKLSNVLIHLVNVLLVFWLVVRLLQHNAAANRSGVRSSVSQQDHRVKALDVEHRKQKPARHFSNKTWWNVSAAAFSAAIFAVHPVVVEPVVWVAGREELLMTLGALGCLHCHLTARRLARISHRRPEQGRKVLPERRKRSQPASHPVGSQDREKATEAPAHAAVARSGLPSGEKPGAENAAVVSRQIPIDVGGKSRWALAWHFAALACCAVACLSNAVGAVIPFLIVAWDMLTWPRPRLWGIALATAPLFLIAMLTVLLKGPGTEAALAREAGVFSVQRLMLVLNVYWLNLKSLAWPTDLALSYSFVRPKSLFEGGVILGLAAICLTCVALWMLRRSRLVLFGVFWFGLALAPTSQMMPHHIHRADRFLYLPLVGLAVALGAGLKIWLEATAVTSDLSPRLPAREGAGRAEGRQIRRQLGNALKSRWAAAAVIAMSLAVLLLLAIQSTGQVRAWRTGVSLWEHCVSVAPDNPVCHRALADSLAKQGQLDRAIPHYQTALELEPDYIDALANLAFYLVTCDDARLRNDDLAMALAERGCELTKRKDPGLLRTLAVACTNRANALARGRQFRPAIRYYRQAIDADPDFQMALLDLAFLLSTCTDQQLRNGEEAVRLAERACRLIEHPDPARLSILAAAYAEARRFDEAITTIEKAIELAQAVGNRRLVEELQRQLKLYQNRSPYRAPAGNEL